MGLCTTGVSTAHTSVWVSSPELEEAPLNKSLWSVPASFTCPHQHGLWGPSSGRWVSLVAGNFSSPEPVGSWAGGEKNQNSHVSWVKGQSWHRQDSYSPHTSQTPLVFNAFSNLQMYQYNLQIVLIAGLSPLLMWTCCELGFNSPQLLNKLVSEFWLSHGMLGRASPINRLHMEEKPAKIHPGSCS